MNSIRLGDGLRLELEAGPVIAIDSERLDGDVNVLTHAHGDHLPGVDGDAVCSPLTADLAGVRGAARSEINPTHDDRIALRPAGHVPGSRSALITDPGTGRRICVTGDVCTRDRFDLEGFRPPSADVLVLESTYGTPEYVFPPQESVRTEIDDWLADTMDRPVLLFGYALGRAQTLQHLVADSPRERLFVTRAVERVNDVIAAHTGTPFQCERYGPDVELGPGDALVLPMGSGRLDWIESMTAATDAITAGFSGWAIDDSFRFRRGFDRGFPLSDHCDFEELMALVEAVGPERVYTHHGAADELASAIVSRLGIEARSLKRNQSTLGAY